MRAEVDKRYVILTIIFLVAVVAFFFLGLVFGIWLWIAGAACMVAFIIRSITIAKAAYNDKSPGGFWFFFR